MQSPEEPSQSPPWAPPKAPLPPSRLVNIANALGVPLPAVRNPPTRSRSESGSLPARSPTPSGSTSSTTTSKYLLHVIPPLYLARFTGERTPVPPPPTNGYHAQFRRGVLVPVYANFQTQLAVIAKEYALPSTTGMVLYLASSLGSHELSQDEPVHEPGPRLSEEIWHHIWSRVLKAEQLDLLPPSPQLYRLDPDSESHSTASLPQLRPLLSAGASQSRFVTSPSSATSSTTDLRTNSKSPSLASPSDPGTPDTSQASIDETAAKANGLVLPGLGSPSLIPVLAKVEFDVDHRKATWYEPWMRSRKINHAKRVRRKPDSDAAGEGTHENQPPLAFLTGTKGAVMPEDGDFSDEEDSDGKSDDENVTARVGSHAGVDRGAGMHTEKKTKKRIINGSLHPKDQLARSQLSDRILPGEPLRETNGEDELDGYNRVRSPEESEKRVGAIYEDLDLGLDPTEDYDDNDPYDKRRSQFLMKAQLDEIERAMLQLSPRALKTSTGGDSSPTQRSPSKATHLSPSPSKTAPNRMLETPSPEWPPTSFASLEQSMSPVTLDGPAAPPLLAVNGVTTDASASNTEISPRTRRRRQDLKREQSLNATLDAGEAVLSDSPIPLPPDPFGRYPDPLDHRVLWDENIPPPPMPYYPPIGARQGMTTNGPRTSTTTAVTSRFSTDSTDEAIAKPSNRATIMSMKGIKKFWRRSDKSSQPADHLASAPNTGMASASQPSYRPERPSREDMDLPPIPDIVSSPRVPSFPMQGRTSTEQMSVPPTLTTLAAPSSRLDGLHFNQESPYPTRMPAARYSPQPIPHPPLPPEPEKTVRKSILKWATKSRGASISNVNAEPRTSSDHSRPPSRASGVIDGLRGKKPSVAGLVLGHVPTQSTDIIPPSPRLPEQFFVGPRQATPLPTLPSGKRQSASNGKPPRSSISSQLNLEHHLRSSSRSSSHSRRSLSSSRDSHSSRPSFDASQFEMVSPKASALSYPFHGLDHD